MTAREIDTALLFDSLKEGNHAHLNEIAACWRDVRLQERTDVRSTNLVTMNLLDSAHRSVRVSFPDLSGEAYRRMWEERECDAKVAEILRSGSSLLLFVHADDVRAPHWVVEETEQMKMLGLKAHTDSIEVPWKPEVAPTQVKLVDILQMLNAPPLNIGLRRLVIIFSAWDKVEPEGRTPGAFLRERLPLLQQYLGCA